MNEIVGDFVPVKRSLLLAVQEAWQDNSLYATTKEKINTF